MGYLKESLLNAKFTTISVNAYTSGTRGELIKNCGVVLYGKSGEVVRKSKEEER